MPIIDVPIECGCANRILELQSKLEARIHQLAMLQTSEKLCASWIRQRGGDPVAIGRGVEIGPRRVTDNRDSWERGPEYGRGPMTNPDLIDARDNRVRARAVRWRRK